MNYEKLLMQRLLQGDAQQRETNFKQILDAGVTQDYFVSNPEYFDFAYKHRKTYGSYPAQQTFLDNFKIEDLNPQEPINFYLNGIKDRYHVKLLQSAINAADNHCVIDSDIIKATAVLNKAIKQIENSKLDLDDLSLSNSVDERLSRYEERMKNPGIDGIPSGFPKLDAQTYGWHGGEFNLLVAPAGTMKTWTLCQLIKTSLIAGNKCLIGTIEMGKYQVARRLDSLLSETKFDKIRSGKFDSDEEFNQFKSSLSKVKDLADCVIIGGVGFGESFLRNKIETHRPDIVFVDGLYLMFDDEGGQNHWLQMMNISRALKIIAEEYQVPIVCTTQLNNVKNGSKGDESVTDIMYAQALSQNADNIVSLGRIYDDVLEEYTNRLWMKLLKVREGEGARFQVEWDFSNMELKEVNEDALDISYDHKDAVDEGVKNWQKKKSKKDKEYDESDMAF